MSTPQQQQIIHFKLDKAQLIQAFPPKFMNKNKNFLYSLHHQEDHEDGYEGELSYSRYRALQRPKLFNKVAMNQCQVIVSPDIFQYNEKVKEDEEENNIGSSSSSSSSSTTTTTKHWYVNFADARLFVAWTGSLFAQDEIQVAEHPILASLALYLAKMSRDDTKYTPVTVQSMPTPVLIQNVDRRVAVDVTNFPIYGNNFARASEDVIRKASTVMDIKTTRKSNILAIAAPSGGYGEYKMSEILNIFDTAYTGFKACKDESSQAGCSVTVVHTGHWGCGAFGGNRELMAILQILAARVAQVDYLFYHAFNKDGVTAVQNAQKYLDQLLGTQELDPNNESNSVPLNDIFMQIVEKRYFWGFSDGN
ncbi:hypothetical protein C9374_003176 [Naegleria lovaniensis]|uniref:PARG catalytic Macro domain-containing protein n=1 Tax=Naegleria lovaniensis TaxID=51637 RepID=A0AA88GS58_NAELO|nr:uncharacterized protein C9374_003176 [Naegleria lovaniensis]KAG2386027.1 hypothetical protein C9374_003176 [Naegleria lovaniensis]